MEWKSATEIHEGMTVQVDEKICKVMSSLLQGTGKTARTVHLKLKTIPEGGSVEKRFLASDKVGSVSLDRRQMEYQYKDADFYYFYDEATFEQMPIAREIVGDAAPFLKENTKISVEFLEEKPVNILFPRIAEMEVRSTTPPKKGESDSTYKEATLDNDQTILVPHFIKEGDRVRVDIVKKEYVDRLRKDDNKDKKK